MLIKHSDLNTRRMMDLMSVKADEGHTPLYIHTVNRILREMRIEQQSSGESFKLQKFKRLLAGAGLLATQIAPLNQRLETLESFLAPEESVKSKFKNRAQAQRLGSSWIPKVRGLASFSTLTNCSRLAS